MSYPEVYIFRVRKKYYSEYVSVVSMDEEDALDNIQRISDKSNEIELVCSVPILEVGDVRFLFQINE